MPQHLNPPNGQPHVVIIGAGFGGLAAAKALAKAPVNVTVLDRTNHHLFQPLLYQVATAGVAAPAIAAPTRHILRRQRNTSVLLSQVMDVDLAQQEVLLESGQRLHYDHLIVATGATHSYFGQDHWAPYAPGLKTLDDAYVIRTRILQAFEAAEQEPDETKRADLLRFVVIGGGPTGVEMAGTLAEIARGTLRGEFRHFDAAQAQIILLEGGDRVLSTYPERLSHSAKRQLETLGVQVRLGSRVTDIQANSISYADAQGTQQMTCGNVIWGAGVKASETSQWLTKQSTVEADRAGRLKVLPDLTLPGYLNVHVVGDLVNLVVDGQPVPGIAPSAKQMGRYAATHIMASLRGQTVKPFKYADYGSMATIGRHRAIAVLGGFKFSGLFAWWLWLFAHIFFLIGFRNRLVVMTDWGFQYWTQQRHARIFLRGDLERARRAQSGRTANPL